jgi:hypothetical protein
MIFIIIVFLFSISLLRPIRYTENRILPPLQEVIPNFCSLLVDILRCFMESCQSLSCQHVFHFLLSCCINSVICETWSAFIILNQYISRRIFGKIIPVCFSTMPWTLIGEAYNWNSMISCSCLVLILKFCYWGIWRNIH